jgi:hypothetical protein
MKVRLQLSGVMAATALLLSAPLAYAQVCDDVSDECRTTALEDCVDQDGASVVVQLGGLGAEDGDDNGGTCGGSAATALITFTRVDSDTLEVAVNNSSCVDSSVTGAYWNMSTNVMSLLSSAVAGNSVPWTSGFSPTTMANDGFGFRADGFGNFDATSYNGNLNPNGGDPSEIMEGDTVVFTLDYDAGFNLCDILSEISTPPPGEMNRNVVARFQSCGDATLSNCQGGDSPGINCTTDDDCTGGGSCNDTDSAYIGPCTPDDDLLAVIGRFQLTPGDGKMTVAWDTTLEVNNAGFNVLRREVRGGQWGYVNVDFIPGEGDSVSGASYSFEDTTAVNGVDYLYRIEDIDFDGRHALNQIDREVANPQNPPVKLQSPGYGQAISLERGLKVGYESTGLVHGAVSLQISSDAAFSEATTISTRVPVRGGINEFQLTPNVLRQMERISGDGVLYWRLEGVSDTFVMEVQ